MKLLSADFARANPWRAWEDLVSSRSLTTQALRARSDERVARIARHAAEKVPDHIRSTEDLRVLPVTNKRMHQELPPESFLAAGRPAWLRVKGATSGSTGEPFVHFLDAGASAFHVANHAFADAWFGLGLLDRSVRVRNPPHRRAPQRGLLRAMGWGRAFYERLTQLRISAFEVGELPAATVFERIARFRPKFVTGYTSGVATIAHQLLEQGFRFDFKIQGVITEAEALTPDRARLIAECFQAPVYSRYGLSEFGMYSALGCPVVPGAFHILTDSVAAEVILEDGSPAAPGEPGRLILTDLHNFVMPFLRWDTGDIVIAGEGPCACGCALPVIREIQGRSLEVVCTPTGKHVSAVALSGHLCRHGRFEDAIRQFQLIQDSTHRARLLVVPSPECGDRRLAQLQEHTGKLFPGMKVTVECVSQLPAEPSGKRPIVKVASGCASMPGNSAG
jgi:phenylacetate-CoA ligase